MHFDEQQILSLSKQLWYEQLGLNIAPIDETTNHKPEEKTWSSCINISGAWHGALVLECPESIVRHAAAMLFSSDGEETSNEDIQDALKELSVMIGKRMRPILPESSKLSRPSIVAEADRAEVLHSHAELTDLQLTCEGRPIRIALLKRDEEPAASV
jgi:hypothetical protein